MCDLQSLALALRMIERVDPHMPIRQALCFLQLAMDDEPINHNELAKRVGLTLSSTSRYIKHFGPEGLGLVTNVKHPDEGRYRIVSLTRKGRELAQAIVPDVAAVA